VTRRFASVLAEPALAPLVARWLLDAFGHPGSPSFEEMVALVLAPPEGPEESFVLLDDTGEPAGTATLARRDLKSRPDLTPWLAGLFVEPAFRGRGYATEVVAALVGWGRSQHGVRTFVASVGPWNAPSLRVVEKLGFRQVGAQWDPDDGEELVFELVVE
jgi:RimJ/RimL family protein N-acetyltransferase